MFSGAILCLVASMTSIAVATRVSSVATLTLVLFLGSVVTLLVSIAWMAREICGSHDAVRQKSAAQGAGG
jgi:hypothetical protein